MANLIIKSSADDLVLQGSDASPAITVGATGTTTFAENATLSGTANNLGTATAGTLSSSVTFPAVHVVQTTTSSYGTTKTIIAGSSGTYNSTVVTGQITPLYDDSSIIINANFNCQIEGESSGDCGYALKWYKSGTGITDGFPAEINMGDNVTNQTHSTFYRYPVQYDSMSDNYGISLINNDCETTNTLTYTLYASKYDVDDKLHVGSTQWNNTKWIIFFQEIKR